MSVRERAQACLLVVDFDIRHARKELVVSLRLAPGHATTGWAHVSDAAAAMQRNGSVGALGRLCQRDFVLYSSVIYHIISNVLFGNSGVSLLQHACATLHAHCKEVCDGEDHQPRLGRAAHQRVRLACGMRG